MRFYRVNLILKLEAFILVANWIRHGMQFRANGLGNYIMTNPCFVLVANLKVLATV